MAKILIRAPKQHGRIAAFPELTSWRGIAVSNAAELHRRASTIILGRTLEQWRAAARRELFEQCQAHERLFGRSCALGDEGGPWIVSGHQPEPFHAGVWIKNVATALLARALGGVGVHVLADHDLVKSSSMDVPCGSDARPLRTRVPLDRYPGEIPHEFWNVGDPSIFNAFPGKVAECLSAFTDDSVCTDFFQGVADARGITEHVGIRLAEGRRRVEASLLPAGVRNLEAPMSALAEGEVFRMFAAELMRNAVQFAEIHNQRLFAFRKSHRIRSRRHPFPPLLQRATGVEAPFWACSIESRRRRPVFVERTQSTTQVFADGVRIGELNPTGDARRDILRLEPHWRIRPRALTTTMFLRFAVADLFVHGIGGGKYDELTDDIAEQFLGIAPPSYAVLTGTCLIAGQSEFAAAERLREAVRRRRDLDWNPDRYLPDGIRDQGPVADWIERKYELAASEGGVGNRGRFEEFRRLNQRLREFTNMERRSADAAVAEAVEAMRRESILTNREYPFFLHEREELHKLVSRLAESL